MSFQKSLSRIFTKKQDFNFSTFTCSSIHNMHKTLWMMLIQTCIPFYSSDVNSESIIVLVFFFTFPNKYDFKCSKVLFWPINANTSETIKIHEPSKKQNQWRGGQVGRQIRLNHPDCCLRSCGSSWNAKVIKIHWYLASYFYVI